jgi:predicted ATPase
MSHPFGDLLSQYLHRQHGLSQARLAAGILQDPAVIARMCRGERLTGRQARPRVVAVLGWLAEQGVLGGLDEANALLAAGGMSALTDRDPAEVGLLRRLPAVTPHTIARPPLHNLPAQATSFIGRERELAELHRLMPSTRLLTLTGASGVGKTRLAIEAGWAICRDAKCRAFTPAYPDGVWLVELAPLTDPALVPCAIAHAIATVLEVREDKDRPLVAALVDAVRDSRLLLILDNCEHVIEACAQVAGALLRGSEGVRLLATSREPLQMAGELTWRVPSLHMPPAPNSVVAPDLGRYEAVQLFVERARFARPAFELTAANALDVQRIVTRLDGIPLAIELAAARVRALPVEAIAAHLGDAFQLLTGGHAELPRHQTLRGAIDWSYDLLTEPERALLRRLSVFAGGWTLEACETVCSPVLDVLSRLVDKSLVATQVDESGEVVRYRLLEMIRQYAAERLAETGEGDQVHARLLQYLVEDGGFVHHMINDDRPADQVKVLNSLRLDLDNMRHAMDWAVASGRIQEALVLAHAWFDPCLQFDAQEDLLNRMHDLVQRVGTAGGTQAEGQVWMDISDLHRRRGGPGAEEWVLVGIERGEAIGRALNDHFILADLEMRRCCFYAYQGIRDPAEAH